VQPLTGLLVVDLTKYLPGSFAGRELLRLGARVVRVEPPDGDPTRRTAPAWDDALNAGKESVVCDLKSEPELAQALLARADVVLEGFRPGVAARLGVGPDAAPMAVYTAITGFGDEGRHAQRAGHDLNYLGWAGVLEDTSPSVPPVQIADLAAGAQGAVIQILAALLERARTGRGSHIVVSMTHGAHRFVAHRLGGEPVPRLLTGGVACYRIYETADGRTLTVAALEPKFWRRLCELVGKPELESRAFEPRLSELEEVFASRPLDEWLALFEGEDVCVGPVATLAEAAAEFSAREPAQHAPLLGEHTAAWRAELQL
jgi:crotonobetainyl-CoA:carnitine CoA-transferase CaiB-like acyl-CoA transferase